MISDYNTIFEGMSYTQLVHIKGIISEKIGELLHKHPMSEDEKNLASDGHKILAIKMLRKRCGIGLLHAKHIVDNFTGNSSTMNYVHQIQKEVAQHFVQFAKEQYGV